jgi:TonB family protein
VDALSRWTLTFLLNSLWQVTLVVGAMALGDLWLRRAPARYRHALWVMALVAAVVLPAASTRTLRTVSADEGTLAQVPGTWQTPLPAATSTGPAVPVNMHRPQPDFLGKALQAGIHRGIAVPPALMRALVIVYLSLLILMLLRFAGAWLRARTIRRLACAEPLPDDVIDAVERCGRAMPRPRRYGRAVNPSILWSSQVAGPVTVGAFRGDIILPKSLLDGDAREDLEAALAHEMAHVCRHDYLWNLICELLLLPVAFHPCTLLVRRRLAEVRELACDELAARVLDPSRYARSLVHIANQISKRAAVALKLDYTLGVFDANILEERVMTLLKPRASGRLAKFSVLLGTLFIASSCLLASRFSLGVSQASTTSNVAATSSGNQVAEYHGALKGVSSGVSGGIAGGVAGGVSTATGSDARTQEGSEAATNGLSGIVVDSSGARVPKAMIWLVNRDSGAQQQTETDETGGFAFKDLPAGRYTLNVVSAGMGGSFRMFTLKAEGQPPFFPFVLQPGAVAESAVVTAKLPPGVSVKAGTSAGPRRIRIGGSVEGAKLIENSPQPVYPESARTRGIQGLVLLEATISAEGVPMDLKVLSSPSEDLSQAAEDAVRQWKYHSTLLNGDPIAVLTTIAVDFRLED